MSLKFAERSSDHNSRMAVSGGTLIGVSSSSTDAFSSSSDSSSFQPIKTQVAIPTAHVMPSMLDRTSCSAGEPGTPRSTLPSSLPVSLGDTARVMPSYDSDTPRQSQIVYRNLPCANRTSAENSCDNSLFWSSDQSSVKCTQKPIRLDSELTINCSAFPSKHSIGAWSQLQMYSPGNSDTTATGLDKGQPKMFQDAKPPTDPSRNCGKQGSFGLNPASMYSTPSAAPAQKQEACSLHPHENCSYGSWKHLDCVQLQLEQMQLQNKAACYYPLVNCTSVHALDPAQWIGIVSANENLLREKEILIDRQKQHIFQLEQKVRESELQVHSALYGPPVPYGDIYLLRMQELQRENAFLRAQFTEKTETLAKEKIELERSLAASEAGMKQIQETHKETTQKQIVELQKQEERVKSRDKHIDHLKKKCQKELDQNREKQQRIETLERYVADLPVLDDHRKLCQQLKESQQAVASLQETVATLERELRDVRTSCREKELQLGVQKHKEMELLSTVHSLQDKVQYGKPLAAANCTQETEREKGEKDALQKERDLLRKIVENQKKKMDQLSSRVKDLEEQIAQDEGTSQALKAEALRQENALQQLRRAVKELSAQNQELIENNMTFQEHIRQMELGQPSGEITHLTQELQWELGNCLQDLQSVYSVVTQRAQGKDPNLSLLLGIHSVQCSVKEKEDLLKPDTLLKKLEEAKELHKEIEDLRTAISDRYAQDVGDNCITQ